MHGIKEFLFQEKMLLLLLKTGIFKIFILDIASVGDTNDKICENLVTVKSMSCTNVLASF